MVTTLERPAVTVMPSRGTTSRPSVRVTVCVIDDHAIYRCAIVGLLRGMPEVVSVYEAGGAADGVRCVQEAAPDIVLISARAATSDALASVRAVRAAAPATAIVLLTESDRVEDGIDAIRAGARGLINRDVSVEELRRTIVTLGQGGAAVPPSLMREVVEAFRRVSAATPSQQKPSLRGLTIRERSVMLLVGAGRSNQEIAAMLGYGLSTVKADLRHSLQKLGLRSRQHAAAYVALTQAYARPETATTAIGGRRLHRIAS